MLERSARFDFVILFFILYLCFNTGSITYVNGDTGPAVFLPMMVLNFQTVFFDNLTPTILQSPDFNYAFPEVNGHFVSLFPIVTPVLVIPVYAAQEALAILLNIPITLDMIGTFAKVSASLIAAASSTLVYLTVKELISRKTALITACVYAFATSTWSVSSHALWQHGMVQLLLIFLIYCIIRHDRQPSIMWIILMGVASGLFVFNRPPDSVLLLPVIIYILKECRSSIFPYAAAGVAAGLPFLIYNLLIFGNVFGGYQKNLGFFTFSPEALTGFVSLLVAPNTGLFIFAPVLILAIFGYLRVRSLDQPVVRELLTWFGPVLILDIVVYSFFGLWSTSTTFSYGQRFLTGLVPVLALYMAIIFRDVFDAGRADRSTQIIQVVIILLVAVSVVIQAIGVFFYPFYPEKSIDEGRVWDTGQLIIVDSFETGIQKIQGIRMLSFGPLPPVFRIPVR